MMKRTALPENLCLTDLLFSWSLEDIFNENLYINKAERIPESFESVRHYLRSFVSPLLEETRAELSSSMEAISSAPFAEVISVNESKPYGKLLYDVKVDYWRNISNNHGKEPYRALLGDVIVFTESKLETISDLQREGRIWILGNITILSGDDEGRNSPTLFKVKTSNDLGVKDGMKKILYVTFLMNMTTSERIWNALHMLGNLEVIKKVLCTDSVVEETCTLCPVEERNEIWAENFGLSSKLNESQYRALVASIRKMQCNHKSFVELIWGAPGTGKTRMLSVLLWILLQLKCRTLACAPTNVAITEVASRVLKLEKESFETGDGRDVTFCCLGNILLFGKKDQIKVGSSIEEIYLDYRVEKLAECFGPLNGWKHCFTSMIEFLEGCVSQYQNFCLNEKINDKEPINRNGNVKVEHNSFLEFMKHCFRSTALALGRCISVLSSHIPKKFLHEVNFQRMVSITILLDHFETLLYRDNLVSEELMELFSQPKLADAALQSFSDSCTVLYRRRSECLCALRTLQHSLDELNLPNTVNRRSIVQFCFQMASLILCTVSSSYKLHSVSMEPLHLLVIDEASQLKECESVIPLKLPGIRHAILIGDQCQLPAMVRSNVSDEAGFGRSLFERLSILGHSKHLLNMQYRMHPTISSFPNSKFYQNQIKDAPCVESESYTKCYLPGPMFGPYSFINISGGKEIVDVGGSRKNMVEVAIVVKIVQMLYKAFNTSKEKVSVGVVSPYAAQVSAIQQKLGQKYENNGSFTVKVKSIDGFQGGEEDIIILSTVRSTSGRSIGFISSSRRTNVALTRARHSLWILGNERTLTNNGSIWEELVCNAKIRNCLFDAGEDTDFSKVILEVKKDLDQLDDLLNGDSLLFKSARWKIVFSDNFRKSFVKIRSSETKNLVLLLLTKLSSGWRPKRSNSDVVCECSSHILKQFKVERLYVVCSIDIVKESQYIQVLKVWDVLPLEDIQKLVKRLDGIFRMYTDDYLNRCKVKCNEGDLEVPMSWLPSHDIVQFKDLSNCNKVKDSDSDTFDGERHAEDSKVNESLLLMKFYSLSTDFVSHLLSGCDGRELGLPFELTEKEKEIILYKRSTFILGRSGTGKTTVLTMKLFQNEQLYHIVSEGFHEVRSNPSTSFSWRHEALENDSETKEAVLHQIFVTVSPRLCHVVKQHMSQLKSFVCGGNSSTNSNSLLEDGIDHDLAQFIDIPDSFVDLPSKWYPLVITFHKFLMMLDGTIGTSYFERFPDARQWYHGKSTDHKSRSVSLETFIRTREVNYDRFSSYYWPHFNIELTKKLDPSSVFTEIMSAIKGGLRASGVATDGNLCPEEYILLSEGRASTLSKQKREKIYDIFLKYEKEKVANGDFDFPDLVNDLHRRLKKNRYEGDGIDFVYIDEVQDLSMRQIALFKYICKNVDEGFVFAGDRAQTIARGIDFRFEDIRCLFYKEFVLGSRSDVTDVRKGKDQISDIFHLSQNFRTHSGVLKLAQSVVELLYHFFPLSIDILKPETSLLLGEAPVLLQFSNNENAIKNIFQNGGNGNVCGDAYRFGAEQVILVRDDCLRKEICQHIGKKALVLTILECKGLEFQDVLLYNFFSSSPFRNQWRVIYEYMTQQDLLDSASPQSFPSFSLEKHDVLCSELKQLYVAITRTKQRLWVFENDEAYFKPMFDYWKKLRLVQLFHEHNYNMAMTCFQRAGDAYWERLAKATGLRVTADRMSGPNPEISCVYLREAAEIFYLIGKAELAAQCFFKLNEFERAGSIYLENSELDKAGECFSRAGLYKRAAEVYAKAKLYSKSLSACTDGKFFDLGLQYIQSWEKHAEFYSDKMIEMDKIVQNFLQGGALHYYEHKYNRAMMKFVKYFHSRDMIRTFLKNLNCLNELLLLEKERGNLLEAADIAKQKGDLLLEADLVEKAGQFREATMLILWYVFSNYLNPFRSKLRPVGHLNKKDDLLTRAKSIAKNHSDPFYEFACEEVDILSKGNTYPEVLDIGLEFLQCWKQNAPTDVGRVKRIYEILIIEQKILERCAHHYHYLKDKQTMMRYVKAFHSIDSIRILLKDLNCFDELLLLEEEWGNFLEAAKIAKQKGDLLHEAYLLEKARCLEAASMCG